MLLQGRIGPGWFLAEPQEPAVLSAASIGSWSQGEPREAGPGEPAAAAQGLASRTGHSGSVRGTVKGRKGVSKTELLEGGLISQAGVLLSHTTCRCRMVIRGAEPKLQSSLGPQTSSKKPWDPMQLSVPPEQATRGLAFLTTFFFFFSSEVTRIF